MRAIGSGNMGESEHLHETSAKYNFTMYLQYQQTQIR